MGGRQRYTLEELQALRDEERAADTGLCDEFEQAVVDGLPPGMSVHGPLCGCSSAMGWIETDQLCRHCGRHPQVH
jgi:hypothetical protein